MKKARYLLPLLIFVLLTTACGSPAASSGTTTPVVLATTTFLADIARNVAGDRVSVESLLPTGADPHSYQPTPQDAARIADSQVLIANGADYEQFLGPLLDNAGSKKMIIEASSGITLRKDPQGGHGIDPHMWLDPNNVIAYVGNIREGLTHFDPNSAAVYQANADAYVAKLKNLDAWISDQVSQIPADQRLLVTNHESLGYFAARYSFTVVGTVVESFSSDASPSAGQMAGLIDQIRTSAAPAIFLDASDNSSLATQIASETGVRVVTDLHLESLTDGAPAATYIDMMKYDVTQIVNALK